MLLYRLCVTCMEQNVDVECDSEDYSGTANSDFHEFCMEPRVHRGEFWWLDAPLMELVE